jgi:hypothetical protein
MKHGYMLQHEWTFFGGNGAWTLGFVLARWVLYDLSHISSPDMNELWKHCVKWSKPNLKDHRLCDSIYKKHLK